MIHASPLPDVEIPEVPVTTHVLQHAERLADKPAIIDGPTGRALTYGQLAGGIRALAGGLVARGFGKGDVLAILAPNLPEYAIVFHGVAMAGATVTTINPTYTSGEVRHQLLDAGATMLVTIGMFLDVAREAIEGTDVETIHTIDGAEGSEPIQALFGEPLAEHADVDLDQVVVLPYSSGTTGLPKGVMLTHRNLVANIQQTLVPAEMTEDETSIAVLPFFHIYGMQVLMNCGLVAGGTLVTMPRFDLEMFLRIHQDHGVTRSFVAPPIVLALAKHPMVDDFDLSKLAQVFSGAAPLSAELGEEAAARIGAEVVQGYGMTELSPVTHLTPPGHYKPGSAGITAPNTKVRIVDVEGGHDLGIDEDGEVWIQGPQVMAGYLNNQQATDETIVEGGTWLRTGDIGHIDGDGHLFIVDRLKELIKFKGFQVAPAELEAMLLTHPAIADSAVIGRPDDEAGELPIAFVVSKPGQEVTAEELQEFVAEKVATYKRLHEVTFLEEIPKSASGKILRRELRDDYA